MAYVVFTSLYCCPGCGRNLTRCFKPVTLNGLHLGIVAKPHLLQRPESTFSSTTTNNNSNNVTSYTQKVRPSPPPAQQPARSPTVPSLSCLNPWRGPAATWSGWTAGSRPSGSIPSPTSRTVPSGARRFERPEVANQTHWGRDSGVGEVVTRRLECWWGGFI